ncbi:hypothetical protein MIS46_10855 [Wielerella bovis]|uniref:hypothetical protein n=1 Tax=Wielerella bovis TaxID=2917790 RepID=UPI00201A10FD|nr:hypothetical protein [Wielerella bovis]ULJ62432.1 hypothetical protein MIS46_10855 [Wielerella bovis]
MRIQLFFVALFGIFYLLGVALSFVLSVFYQDWQTQYKQEIAHRLNHSPHLAQTQIQTWQNAQLKVVCSKDPKLPDYGRGLYLNEMYLNDENQVDAKTLSLPPCERKETYVLPVSFAQTEHFAHHIRILKMETQNQTGQNVSYTKPPLNQTKKIDILFTNEVGNNFWVTLWSLSNHKWTAGGAIYGTLLLAILCLLLNYYDIFRQPEKD